MVQPSLAGSIESNFSLWDFNLRVSQTPTCKWKKKLQDERCTFALPCLAYIPKLKLAKLFGMDKQRIYSGW